MDPVAEGEFRRWAAARQDVLFQTALLLTGHRQDAEDLAQTALQPMPHSSVPEPPPHVLSCTDGTATTPMVYVVAQGQSRTAGAVYPDHHAVVAQAVNQPMLSTPELLAIATDPQLSGPVITN